MAAALSALDARPGSYKVARKVGGIALTWQQIRAKEFAFSAADRAWAREQWLAMGRTDAFNIHHANTLLGHSPYRNSVLPMGGLGRGIASARWNPEVIAAGLPHARRHQMLQMYEDVAAGLVNRWTIGPRGAANALSDPTSRF